MPPWVSQPVQSTSMSPPGKEKERCTQLHTRIQLRTSGRGGVKLSCRNSIDSELCVKIPGRTACFCLVASSCLVTFSCFHNSCIPAPSPVTIPRYCITPLYTGRAAPMARAVLRYIEGTDGILCPLHTDESRFLL